MIRLENINKTYFGAQPLHVLKGIDLHIGEGEMVSIMGASGSGKSTLLNILGILDNYDSGDYRLNGKLVKNLTENQAADMRNQLIGFIFQSFNLIPFKTAMENDEDGAGLNSIQKFTNALLTKSNKIALNPMDYVDKTVVEYRNPGRTFPNPYATSMYTGMLFNYFC